MKRRRFLGGAALGAGALAVSGKDPEEKVQLPGRTKNTKFACNVEMWFRRERDFLKRLEGAARLGYSAVEFWPWQGKNIDAVADLCDPLKLEVAPCTAGALPPGRHGPRNHRQFA